MRCPLCDNPRDKKSGAHTLGGQRYEFTYADDLFCYLKRGETRYRAPARFLSQVALKEHFSQLSSFDPSIGEFHLFGEALLIEESSLKGWIPLAAWRMKVHVVALELVWSWLRQVTQGLVLVHRASQCHGQIDQEHLFVSASPLGGAPQNRVQLIRHEGRTGAHTPKGDLHQLARLFRTLISIEDRSGAALSLHNLLNDMERGEYEDAGELWETIQPFERLYQVDVYRPEVKQQPSRWQRRFLLVFPLLFFLSLGVALLWPKKEEPPPRPPTPKKWVPLQEAPQHTPPHVERYRGEWDRAFPLYRLSSLVEGVLFADLDRLRELAPLSKVLNALGLAELTPYLEGHAVALSFETTPKGIVLGSRFVRLAPSSGAPPRWRLFKREATLLKEGAPPQLLTGHSGRLLEETGFSPTNTRGECFLLYWKRPQGAKERGRILGPLLGGVQPIALLVRFARSEGRYTLRLGLSFGTPTAARLARGQARIHLKSFLNGTPGDEVVLLRGQNLLLQGSFTPRELKALLE